MLKSLTQYLKNMIVVKGIENGFAFFSEFYKLTVFKYPELMGNCALSHI